MAVPRGVLVLTLFVILSACLCQNVHGKKSRDVHDFMKSFDKLAQMASTNPSFINPFKLIARVLSFLLFPARFVLRFVTTIISVVALSLIGCQIFPVVDCGFSVRDKIPEFMSNLQEEFDFYLNLAQTDDQ